MSGWEQTFILAHKAQRALRPCSCNPRPGQRAPLPGPVIVSLRPRKGESKDEGEGTSNSQHAKQCSFLARGKKCQFKGLPQFPATSFPPGRQEPAVLMENRGMIKRDVLEAGF